MDSNLSAATARSEQRFIGCLLNGDARALDSGLKAADFTDDFCRRVFSAALMLEERGQTCDLVTLTDTASDIDASAAIDPHNAGRRLRRRAGGSICADNQNSCTAAGGGCRVPEPCP
ncbi:MAG: DnaB-like helicase N-terminal domain-containing protein [Christensenellales bacterium]